MEDTIFNVKSEIAPLKKVLLHRPGRELEHLVPASLEQLLFDDIPYLEQAQIEHDYFASVLVANGAEVVYLEDLVTEVFNIHPELVKPFIVDIVKDSKNGLAHAYSEKLEHFLLSIEDTKSLLLSIMSGITETELGNLGKGSLASYLSSDSRFVLEPIPNLYFTRDAFAVIGNGVAINRMYTITRRRETLFAEYIFKYHPLYSQVNKYYERKNLFNIEGGDIFNLSNKVIMIGISERTSPEGIEVLARSLFEKTEVEEVIAFKIPKTRAFMHLDTVLTQVDYDKFVIHPYIRKHSKLFSITKSGITELTLPLEQVLAKALEREKVTLINCGGDDMIASEREQWNDGSNTLCISPGKVIAYNRNVITNRILENNGIEIVQIPSSELSRGRGGPRCMSMPLLRGEL